MPDITLPDLTVYSMVSCVASPYVPSVSKFGGAGSSEPSLTVIVVSDELNVAASVACGENACAGYKVLML
jgi:hypothetical protein